MNIQEINKRRLRWKCRRGMLELDIILQNFFENQYEQLKENEKSIFAQLLDCEDSELWTWFMQNQIPEDNALKTLVQKINGKALKKH